MTDVSAVSPPAGLFPGFWRRLGAYAIDVLLLALICSVIGVIFYDSLAALGSQGRLIGLLLALAYFTPTNSVLGKGQTIGKGVMKLKVVDSEGHCISVERSLLRSFVLFAPFMLNGVWFSGADPRPTPTLVALGALLSLIVIGGMASIAYLYLFNRPSRQSLHDLIAGTFVVVAAPQPAAITATTANIHRIVAGALLVLAAAFPVVFANSKTADTLRASPMMTIYKSIEVHA